MSLNNDLEGGMGRLYRPGGLLLQSMYEVLSNAMVRILFLPIKLGKKLIKLTQNHQIQQRKLQKDISNDFKDIQDDVLMI